MCVDDFSHCKTKASYERVKNICERLKFSDKLMRRLDQDISCRIILWVGTNTACNFSTQACHAFCMRKIIQRAVAGIRCNAGVCLHSEELLARLLCTAKVILQAYLGSWEWIGLRNHPKISETWKVRFSISHARTGKTWTKTLGLQRGTESLLHLQSPRVS